MREQVCVINQRPCGRFSVVKYALAAFRYLVTGIVALVLALLLVVLIVELGQPSVRPSSMTCPLPPLRRIC
jgi:hypothetical protein